MARNHATADMSFLRRLFTGQVDFEFVGRRKLWAIVSAVLILLSLAGLLVRGVDLSIEFTGGTGFIVTGITESVDADELRTTLEPLAGGGVTVQEVDDPDTGSGALVTTPALGELGGEQQAEIQNRIMAETGVSAENIDVSAVGPRWGQAISQQALVALGVFAVLVVVYLTLRFQWRMAVSALITLVHDILFTVGIYALIGFEISPASVIAFLTILGYSLYDTVVVFDRITEEAKDLNLTSNKSYGEFANGALNAVLLRSINTTMTSLLPVGSLLFIGAGLLGATTLNDLALALFIGMLVGTYSSIFVATPVLVKLADSDPRIAELNEKLSAHNRA